MMADPLAAQNAPADQTASDPIASHVVQVVTYNIRNARGNDACLKPSGPVDPGLHAEGKIDLPRIAAVITASGADIVCLQEVDRFWPRSGVVDQPAALASMLNMHMCYGANLHQDVDDRAPGPQQYGTALLSRYPIVSWANEYLPGPEDWERRGMLIATLQIAEGLQALVVNTHLQVEHVGLEDEAIRQRTEQIQTLLARTGTPDLPVIVAGDFNAYPGSPELEAIEDQASGFTDAWRAANPGGEGFTIPASPTEDATSRIDYIWVNAGCAVLEVEVIVNDLTRMASDHFPVLATLSLESSMVVRVTPPEATPID